MKEIFKLHPLTGYSVGSKGTVKGKRGQHLAHAMTRDGYVNVQMQYNGKAKTFKLHRVVYETHVGKLKKGEPLNHKDGCKTNNAYTNLEKTTPILNARHSRNTGLGVMAISEGDAKRALRLIVKGLANQPIADKLGVEKHAIEHIRLGNTFKWLGKSLGLKYPLPRTGNHGEANGAASKLTSAQVSRICKMLKVRKLPIKDIAEEFGVHSTVVTGINRGKRWKAHTVNIGYTFPIRPRKAT